MIPTEVVNLIYIVAAGLFIFDLKWMSHPRTAVRGNYAGVLGMLLAIVATVFSENLDFPTIAIGVAIGALIGAVAAVKIKMTSMPEMVGILNGFGGGASVLVAAAALIAAVAAVAGAASAEAIALQTRVATVASALIGSVTFFGSYVAFGKLAEFLAVKWKLYPWQTAIKYGFSLVVIAGAGWLGFAGGIQPHGAGSSEGMMGIGIIFCGLLIGGILLRKKDRFPGMNAVKGLSFLAALGVGGMVIQQPDNMMLFWLLAAVSGVLGVLLTLSIGGADMPVVIALLNSYSGLAAAATGFVINNNVLIIAGSLVGASGVILTNIMCKAMNRSLTNVLFGVMGPTSETPDADEVYKSVKATSADEIAMMLDGVERVVIVPGYGMAVSQAQHALREMGDKLKAHGVRVKYAIHPVAGRMPGHMNVLLAEANVPYDDVFELEDINSEFAQTDVAFVIGANDVTNPAAKTDKTSPIYGMPVLDVGKAKTVLFIKRSMGGVGYAGVDNDVFYMDNTMMLLGDAKKMVEEIVKSLD